MKKRFLFLSLLFSLATFAQQNIIVNSLRFNKIPPYASYANDSGILAINRLTGLPYRTTISSSLTGFTDSLNNLWRHTGSLITYGKYIGTNNNFDLRFFSNNTEKMRLDSLTSELQIGGFLSGSNGDGNLLLKGRNNDGSYYGSVLFQNKDGNTVQWITSFNGTSFLYNNGVDERLSIGRTTEMVVNQNGANYDFRIEGDTDPNLFFTDASLDRVGIGTALPSGKLEISGGQLVVPNGSASAPSISISANLTTGFYFGPDYAAFTNYTTPKFFFQNLSSRGFVLAAELPLSWATTSNATGSSPDTYLARSGNKTLTLSSDGTTGAANFTVNGGGVFNESGGDFDFRIESDGIVNMFFVDAGTNRIGIGTGIPDSTLHVVGGFKLENGTQGAGKVLTSDANGGASWQTFPGSGLTLDEGSYTPTLTNTTNISASTAATTYWFRVGDRIHVFGSLEIDATSAGTLSELGMTLPVSSIISNESDLAGTAAHEDGTPVRILGDIVNGRAKFKFTPNTATANKYSFHFSYLYVAP